MEPLKVGVKFCGHCNMHVDMIRLYQSLKERNSDILIAPYANIPDMDVLLVLNACPVQCATRPPFNGLVITATNKDIDNWPIEPSKLLDEIELRLRNIGKAPGK